MKDRSTIISQFMGSKHPKISDLQYQNSWDWLMIVVKKIESLKDKQGNFYRVVITRFDCSIIGADIEILGDSYYLGNEKKITSTYKAIIQFIKIYNDENTRQRNC